MEGEGPNNAYIKPFGEVRQSKIFESKQVEENESRSQTRKDNREWIEEYKRRRGDTFEQLQPQVQLPSRHWYDEYPVEDRRKQLEECIKKRKEEKEYEDEQYQQDNFRRQEQELYQEQYDDKSIQGYKYYNKKEYNGEDFDNRYKVNKSPHFEGTDNEGDDKKEIYSKSYNRNFMIHKRAFLNPSKEEGERYNAFEDREPRQFGKSASHGFERNFKSYGLINKNQTYNGNVLDIKCDLKFNEKSINYDMSEIELPAYCKSHPDGKLLYIITPEGKESELGCVYCVIEINQKKLRHRVVEVKQKLSEYIEHTSKLLEVTPQNNIGDTEQMITKLSTCKEREIDRIREYYDSIIETLTAERDKYISQIDAIADQNIFILSNSCDNSNQKRSSKYDIKLKNFGIELGKVLEGVDDTGIHIKELWKINQDYSDVVSRKMNELKNSANKNGVQLVKCCEFYLSSDNDLRTLTSKICQLKVKDVPITEIKHDDIFKTKQNYDYSRGESRYPESAPKSQNVDEFVPSFGGGNVQQNTKDYYQKYYQKEFYDKYSYKNSHSFSPNRQLKYSYEPSELSKFQQQDEEKLRSFRSGEDEKYDQYSRKSHIRESYDQVVDNKGNERHTTYERYSIPSSYAGYKNSENVNINDIDSKNIEEIKKKYSRDNHSKADDKKINEIYNDYKKEVDLPKQEKPSDSDNSNEDPFSNNGQNNIDNRADEDQDVDIKDAIVKKNNIKKIKTKSKGEKENVLKAIKLKIK